VKGLGLSLGGKHPPFGFERVTNGLGKKALQPIREQQEAIRLMLRLKASYAEKRRSRSS
jgi:hypothetical protein